MDLTLLHMDRIFETYEGTEVWAFETRPDGGKTFQLRTVGR